MSHIVKKQMVYKMKANVSFYKNRKNIIFYFTYNINLYFLKSMIFTHDFNSRMRHIPCIHVRLCIYEIV